VRTGSSSHGAHPRCVPPFAHGWRTGGSAGSSRQALAFDRDDSGNCTSQPARPPALQRREAASAIASECPLYCSCGHSLATGTRPAPCQCASDIPGRPAPGRRPSPGSASPGRRHGGRFRGLAAAQLDALAPGHRASLGADPPWRCSRWRPRRVSEALRDRLAPGRQLGPGRRPRARPVVRHVVGRVVAAPGAPERPQVGRSRPSRTRGPARGSSWLQGRHRPSEPHRAGCAGGGRGPGRKSPFFQNRVQGTSGRNSSRPQIGIEHPGSVHFRGPRPGVSFT
jgi:hypothetical protein